MLIFRFSLPPSGILPSAVAHWCWKKLFQLEYHQRSLLWSHTWRNEAADGWFQTRGTECCRRDYWESRMLWSSEWSLASWHDGKFIKATLNILPGPPSNKGLDVQIHWYIFRRDDGDSDTAWQVLDTWMDNMTLTLKYSLSKDENCTDNGFWGVGVGTSDSQVILTDSLSTLMFNITSTVRRSHHLELRCWALREPSGPP